MNKFAVIVQGVPRPEKRHPYKEVYRSLRETFPADKYDIFYQTWETYTKPEFDQQEWQHYYTQNQIQHPLYFYKEPPRYNAFMNFFKEPDNNIPEIIWNPDYRPLQFFFFCNPVAREEYVITKHFQMIGTALLIKDIKRDFGKYDVFIRTRWDALIKGNFDDYVYNAQKKPKNVFGFEWQKKKTKIRHDHIPRFHSASMSHYYLPDLMVIFNSKAWDSDKILRVNRHKKILPAEWGWGQCLKHLSPIETVLHKYATPHVKLTRF